MSPMPAIIGQFIIIMAGAAAFGASALGAVSFWAEAAIGRAISAAIRQALFKRFMVFSFSCADGCDPLFIVSPYPCAGLDFGQAKNIRLYTELTQPLSAVPKLQYGIEIKIQSSGKTLLIHINPEKARHI
jgi:hypothetical protein